MGHRFESLGLPAHMVAWHGAGLELVHKDLLGDASCMSADTPSADSPVDGGPADTSLAGETVVPGEPRRALREHPARGGQDGDRVVVGQAAPASGRPIQPGHDSEPCAWTGPFLYALERLKPPVRAMWTYWELALDFGGEPDAERRKLWANIIKSLPYKQQVGFWPLSELQGGVMLAKPALFWQGVKEFGATHVLCFGRRACMTLFPDRPFSPGVFRHGDLSVVILPGPDDMLPDNRQAKALAWGLLKDLRI